MISPEADGWPAYVGFAGRARSGKDTAAALMSLYGYSRFAFGDKVRDALLNLNPLVLGEKGTTVLLSTLLESYSWEQLKETPFQPHLRTLAQRMGTEVGRAIDTDIWVNQVKESIPPDVTRIVIPDVRFQNEADFIHSNGGAVICLSRPTSEESFGTEHASESLNLTADYYLKNDGSILEFHRKLLDALLEVSTS
jgi:hypothetical protein